MSNNPQDQKFKKWLDILQQESWQLELIISGFAIFGLFSAKEPIEIYLSEAQSFDNMYQGFFWTGIYLSWYILASNLLVHVVLRGLWIGSIGLRYVSADIEYDTLKYSAKFTKHLKKKVGSFDDYVAVLEKYCSIIFAIIFLLLFYLLGVIMVILSLTLLGLWIGSNEAVNYPKWIGIPLVLFIVFGSLLTFIDFITLGWLKKKKWTTFIYYPFYWVFKYLTLSFLYRPMIYNFLDTKFGRRLSLALVPIYIGVSIVAGTGFSTSNYLKESTRSSSNVANVTNYDDLIVEKTSFVELASIPSKVITGSFLNVFIVYGSSIEDDVFYFNKELKPEEDKRGLYSVFSKGTIDMSRSERFTLLNSYMNTIEGMYCIKIDAVYYDFNFVATQNKRKQLGFETFLDFSDVTRGKHLLEISRKDHRGDSIYYRKITNIPFWYYPD